MILGVIGGLGPLATAYFMELVIKMTEAKSDQEHIEMIIYNTPSVPDRTEYILDNRKECPIEPMIKTGKKLVEQGAGIIAIPCITAHYFHKELEEGIGARIIQGIYETAAYLADNGITKVGIAATDGTISSGTFQKELEKAGIEVVLPSAESQKDVMHIIYKNVKAGVPVEMEKFRKVSRQLRDNGAQIIILGCTELSLIKRDNEIGKGYIDAMEVLARVAVCECGRKLKKEYQSLI